MRFQETNGLLRILCALICLTMLPFSLYACTEAGGNEGADSTEETEAESTTEETTEAAPTALEIIKDGESAYKLIRADFASQALVNSTVALKDRIKARTGVSMKMGNDFVAPGKPEPTDALEILVGETARKESIEVYESLPEGGYTVTIRNNKLVIIGKDQDLTMMALYAFDEQFLMNREAVKEGSMVFSEADTIVGSHEGAFTLKELLDADYSVTASTKLCFHCPKYSDSIRVAQGVASDGTYVYFVIRDAKDAGAVVYKHRLDDGTRVAQSEVLQLGHGNDATFDTKNNRLVVAHGQSEGKILTLIDPETLTVIKDITIPVGSGAISYSPEKDRYAISQGGSTLHFVDGDFKLLNSYSRTKNQSYTAQGMGSDEDYVYFPMSGPDDNVLEVYDWDGKYVTTISVYDDFESESFFWVNGKYYIAYYKGASDAGAYLYEVTFSIIYE